MKKVVLSSIALLILTSCASVGNKIDVSKLNKVENCKTTKSELISLIGEPERTGRQNGYNTMTWEYAKASLVGNENQYIVVFLNNNVVVDYAVNPVGVVQVNDTCSK